MAYPAYAESSTIVGVATAGTTGINVNYPATVNSDDILILYLNGKAAVTWDLPSGFTSISGARRAIYWRRASGSESGTITCTNDNASSMSMYGIIYRFSGCATSGNPYEGYATTTGNSTTVDIPDLASATTGIERLCICATSVNDDVTASDNATNYSQANTQRITTGSDGSFHLYTYQQATAGKPGADSYTQTGGGDFFDSRTMALKPPSVGYANDVIGVASASIGKVNGVATANIAKVSGV